MEEATRKALKRFNNQTLSGAHASALVCMIKKTLEEDHWKSYKSPIQSIFKAISKDNTNGAKASLLNLMSNIQAQNFPLEKYNNALYTPKHLYECMKTLRKYL